MDSSLLNEKEFSPSQWSKRFQTGDQVISHHLKHIEKWSKLAVEEIACELNIPYGESKAEKLDIFGTDLPNDAPILVFVHGGYWQMLSREQSSYPAGPLHKAGFKTIVVGYTLSPIASVAEIIKQIERAAKYVFSYAEQNKSRGIYFAGHSAGGHLVAKMLSNHNFLECLPNIEFLKAAILISGVFDLTGLVQTSNNEKLHLTNEEAKNLSPHFDNYFHLCNYDFRLYILATENDSYAFRKQSRDFYDMLQECCHVENIHFEIKDKMDHFDVMECLTEDDNYLVTLMENDLKHV